MPKIKKLIPYYKRRSLKLRYWLLCCYITYSWTQLTSRVPRTHSFWPLSPARYGQDLEANLLPWTSRIFQWTPCQEAVEVWWCFQVFQRLCWQKRGDSAHFWHWSTFLSGEKVTLVCFHNSNKSLLDLSDVHLQELIGCKRQFLAFVYILDEFISWERHDFVHIEGQVSWLHLVLDPHKIPLQDFLDFLDIRWHVWHVFNFLPLNSRHLRQWGFHLLINNWDHCFDWSADQAE